MLLVPDAGGIDVRIEVGFGVMVAWGLLHRDARREKTHALRRRIIKDMAVLHITEAELARDVHAVLEKVLEGAEIVIEQDHRPVAVIKTPQGPGRSIDECIALAKAYEERLGYAPVLDADFAEDVQAAIDAHRGPLDTSAPARPNLS